MRDPKQITQLASDLSSFVNGASKEDIKQLAKEIVADHRTLQQSTFGLFLECINIWADDFDAGCYDPRNETTCAVSGYIRNQLSEDRHWNGKSIWVFMPSNSNVYLPCI